MYPLPHGLGVEEERTSLLRMEGVKSCRESVTDAADTNDGSSPRRDEYYSSVTLHGSCRIHDVFNPNPPCCVEEEVKN